MASDKRCELCVNWVKTNWHGTEGKCKARDEITKSSQTCPQFLKRK